MTLPPEKLGFKDQRYTLSTFDWPEKGVWSEASYSNSFEALKETGLSLIEHGRCPRVRIYDRQEDKTKEIARD